MSFKKFQTFHRGQDGSDSVRTYKGALGSFHLIPLSSHMLDWTTAAPAAPVYEASIELVEAFDAAAGPAHAAAHSVVDNLLSHHMFNAGPTVRSGLQTALLEKSFQELAQQLYDVAAPSGLILDFRRQWRRLHGMPDVAHGRPDFFNAYAPQHSFGAAVALLVDTCHVSDKHLAMLIEMWDVFHQDAVLERGDSSMPEAMERLALF
ncbi:hypothetical protein B0H12DRAFT_1133486 [Mycena haematopus]|nr:hypothetical protein B0H12DRAFT_1133486 [Mycena haematopus]